MSPRWESHACLQTPTDLHHEVWTWLCGCEVTAALIALCLSLLFAWKAFQEAEELGPYTSGGTVSPAVSWQLGDVGTAAFIKVIWTKVVGCVSPWSTCPPGLAVLPIILRILGGLIQASAPLLSATILIRRQHPWHLSGKTFRPGDSHLGTLSGSNLLPVDVSLCKGSRARSSWSWGGLQTLLLVQAQHLCAWRLFVLLRLGDQN